MAIRRKVKVRIIAETPEASDGKISYGVDALGKALLQKADIFVWPLDQRSTNANGKHGSLHVKCAIADRDRLFVSSANLTQYALTINIEIGLLVYSKTLAGQIADHIDALVCNGVLRQWIS